MLLWRCCLCTNVLSGPLSLQIQALDSEFSDSNRQKCAEAAKPLIQAVDELTTYASSPEFASVPAKISLKVSPTKIRPVMHNLLKHSRFSVFITF